MSIIRQKIILLSLILGNFFTYSIAAIAIYISLSIIPYFTSTAKADCFAISKDRGCSAVGKNFNHLIDSSQCTLNDFPKGYIPLNTICCCSKNSFSSTKPKYLIITSVTAFFAILTALVYFYKKNE